MIYLRRFHRSLHKFQCLDIYCLEKEWAVCKRRAMYAARELKEAADG